MALAKALIKATEGSAGSCTVQFNPKEFQVDKSVSWSPAGGHEEDPKQEFKEPQSAELSVTVYFDGYETGSDVSAQGKQLLKMATIDDALGRPPMCLFVWGNFTFQGVMESVSVKYTMFLETGTPVRAEVALKMKSARGASVATKK